MKNRDVEKNLHKIYFVYNKIDQRRSSTYAINNVEDDSNRFQEFKLKIRKNKVQFCHKKRTLISILFLVGV